MKNLLLFFSFLFSLGISADDNFVDLGLPSGLLWATCNLGASAPEEVGNYYAWGETSPKAFFSEDNYKYKDSPIGLINISGTQYDAATAALGGTWRMPTKEELEELANNCSRTQSTRNGIVCMELTGPNGNKLIIARGGLGEQGTTHEDGYGLWSSTKKASSTAYRAWEWNSISYSYTWQGIPVRPVTSQKPTDASNDIAINEENFPDENFRAFLKEQSYGEDGVITEDEMKSITWIDVPHKEIKSLVGIEYFTSLVHLGCSENQLTCLDMSKNTALEWLDCYKNLLESLNISANTKLTMLQCFSNQLSSLDVSNNTALATLECNSNKLTTLDLSNNTELTGLNCSSNQLTSLDMSKNPLLTSLSCWNNQLTSLNVLKNYSLTSLQCTSNKLTNLNINNNRDLTFLECNANQLTSLDLSWNKDLAVLFCNGNQLSSLDVSNNTNLQELYCLKNQLTSLDVTKNTKLKVLYCYENLITNLDVSKENMVLTDLSCYSNQINKEAMDSLINNLPQQEAAYLCVINQSYSSEGNVCTKTQVSSAKEKGWQVYAYNGDVDVEYEGSDPIENDIIINEENFPDEYFRDYLMKLPYGEDGIITAEEIKGITYMNIGSLIPIVNLKGLEYFTALQYLYLYDAQNLTSLDVSQNTALIKLHCNGSKITNLDLTNNTALTEVYLYSNQITSLDVTKNTALMTLDCGGNQLTSLDVSKNTALEYLGCYGNQLTDLDVSKNTSLATLLCGNNKLTTLDVSMNTTLNYLHCGVNQLARLNVLNNKALTDLECQNNLLTNLDVSKNTALTRLSCSGNQLTSLDVSKNAALTELFCYRNRINEEAMTSLIGSLPIQEHAFLYAIKLDDDTEGNVCTIEQVKAAKGKGWQVMVPYMWGFVEYENYERVIAINEKYFPDENFRNFLSQQNYGRDGWITEEEIKGIISINVSKKNIASLKGIEYFTELTELDCSGNSLIDLDVSKNTALKTLICFNNQLTNLDVSKNTALTKLRCYENQIKGEAMDVLVNGLSTQDQATLYIIKYQGSELSSNEGNVCTTIHVAKAKEHGWQVKYLRGSRVYDYVGSETEIIINEDNFPDEKFRSYLQSQSYGEDGVITPEEIKKITEINVNNKNISNLKGIVFFMELSTLGCFGNQLADLDISNNKKLTYLNCDRNQLTTLDISKNSELTYLSCRKNSLSYLDMSNNTKLFKVLCENNQLTNLDVSMNTELQILNCTYNKLTNIDVSRNTQLTAFIFYNNQIYGDAMDALVGSLPQQKGAELYVINLNDTSEGNICNTTQVNIAKEKGWIVKTAYGADYEGSDPAGIQDITFDKDIKTPIYDLNGRKLKDLSKGINIIEGKKVIVK